MFSVFSVNVALLIVLNSSYVKNALIFVSVGMLECFFVIIDNKILYDWSFYSSWTEKPEFADEQRNEEEQDLLTCTDEQLVFNLLHNLIISEWAGQFINLNNYELLLSKNKQ